jgi:hypothetical protein
MVRPNFLVGGGRGADGFFGLARQFTNNTTTTTTTTTTIAPYQQPQLD